MATPIPVNRVSFSRDEIVTITQGELLRAGPVEVTGVTTDSRAVAPGNLFVALVGEQHDAHRFASAASESGAAAVLVSQELDVQGEASVIRVEDTLCALGALAAAHRRRFSIPVIAITGSVGKTSTKELVTAVLRGMGKSVLSTVGNLNNRIGAPMTLLTLDETHDVAVVEIGMSIPGEIATLAALVQPTLGMVTAVSAAHTEGVGSIEAVAREKGALLEALSQDGVAMATADDALIQPALAASKASRKYTFGLAESADVRLLDRRTDMDGLSHCRFRVTSEGTDLEVTLRLLGEPYARSAAAALTIVHALAPTALAQAVEALTEVKPTPGRMVPFVHSDGWLILDDTYNASPRSMDAALESLCGLAKVRGGRAIAVLGDMLELGAQSEEAHRRVGERVVAYGVHSFVACGSAMTAAPKAALQSAVETDQARPKIVMMRDCHQAAAIVLDTVRAKDVVLVKGSRGMNMERVVEALQRRREQP